MSKEGAEHTTGDAGVPTEASIEAASAMMAEKVLENAAQYLGGEREDFSAFFGVSDIVHKRAATKFEGLLSALGYGEPLQLIKREAKQEALDGANYHLQITLSRIAQYGGRQIIAEATSLMISDEHALEPAYIRYMGATEEVFGATSADQA